MTPEQRKQLTDLAEWCRESTGIAGRADDDAIRAALAEIDALRARCDAGAHSATACESCGRPLSPGLCPVCDNDE